MHLWPNAYKNVKTAMAQQVLENGDVDFQFAKDEERGFIDSLDFKVNGASVKLEYDPVHIDIAKIILNEPLKSGDKITITTPFYVKIPKGIYSRLGHIGESYQMTQWFPKPAVYDRDGWHPIPYLSQGEFYSEFGSYDVKITVPKNYVLGATGDMQNGEEELKWLEGKVAETEQKIKSKSYDINKAGKPNMDFPESSKEMKTLHFKQDNVHDFAWFCDKRFHVLKGEVVLPHSKEKVTSWAMFTNSEFRLWEKSIEYLNDAIYYYSLWNGDYPYKHVTAVDGSISAGGGMEYPNITVIGKSYTASGLEQVIVHEVGHNWFYGILGSNERKNAWMDEGINTFNENRYQETKYPNRGIEIGIPAGLMDKLAIGNRGPRGLYDMGYEVNARRNYDQPLSSSSELFTNMNYGSLVYGKTAIGMDFMLDYLGSELFDSTMHSYYNQWKFKHPQPADIRKVFEEKTGKDLSWFFDDYIKTTKKIDYAISSINSDDNAVTVHLKNVGEINAPVKVTSYINGDVEETKWVDGFEGTSSVTFSAKEVDKYVIDDQKQMPDIDRTNNQVKGKGVFKKVEPLRFELLGSYENPDRTTVFYTPTIGWNGQDKFMLGLALYNSTVPEKKFEWVLNPMYAFGTKSPVGTGSINYNMYPNKGFRRIELNTNIRAFNEIGSYTNFLSSQQTEAIEYIKPWYRNEISLKGELKRPLRKSKQTIEWRSVLINKQFSIRTREQILGHELTYKIINKKVLQPASVKASLVYANSNLSNAFSAVNVEAKYRWNYNVDLKGIDVRFFAGYSLIVNDLTQQFNYSLSGQNGRTDYFYDHLLLGRSADFPNALAQQTTNTQGDFKVNTGDLFGNNNMWVSSLNVMADLPYIKFLKIYVDGGLHPNVNNNNQPQFDFVGGLTLSLRKDIVDIYIPLFYSQNIKDVLTSQNIQFWQQIRFSFNINKLNPFKIAKDITN
jgi:hypothetical protein